MEKNHKNITKDLQVQQLRAWAKKMGYPGEIPDGFELLNASTQHIWRQIIERVRPKNEIDKVKHNILLQKLEALKTSKKFLSEAVIECKNHEYEIWEKKKALQEEVYREQAKYLKHKGEVAKKTEEVNLLLADISRIDSKINDSEAKEYLYMKKQKDLLDKILFVEPKLEFLEEMLNLSNASLPNKQLMHQIELSSSNILASQQNIESLMCLTELEDKQPDSKIIVKEIKDLYHTNSYKDITIGMIRSKQQQLWDEIECIIDENDVVNKKNQSDLEKIDQVKTQKLYAFHIEKVLETKKLKNELKKQSQFGANTRLGICELHLNGLQQNVEYVFKGNGMVNHSQDQTELRKGRKNLACKINLITSKWETYQRLDAFIMSQYTSPRHCLMPSRFVTLLLKKNASILSQSLHSEEVSTSLMYNLEYTRQRTPGVFTRDIDSSRLSLDTINDEILKTLVSRLGLPITNPDGVWMYFKQKADRLRKFEAFVMKRNFIERFNVEQLDIVDVQELINEKCFIGKSTVMQIVESLKHYVEDLVIPKRRFNLICLSLKLWVEMSFPSRVSSVRKEMEECVEYDELFNYILFKDNFKNKNLVKLLGEESFGFWKVFSN